MADLSKKLSRFFPLNFAEISPPVDVEIGHFAAFPNGFSGTNPSIVPFDGGYLVCIRGVNYRFLTNKLSSSVFTVGDRHMSVNRFMLLDRDFALRRTLPALDDVFDDVEDIKLFAHAGQVMGFGSSRAPGQTGPYDCSAHLITIDAGLDGGSKLPIPSPYGFKQEKNWAPFIYKDALHFIYSFDPLVVLRYDQASGTVEFASGFGSGVAPDQLKFLVGGASPGIPIGPGYVFAAHRRRVSFPQLDHNYVSWLYYFDPVGGTLQRGPYFSLGPASVQFVNGMAIDGQKFVVSYGVKDNTAHICQLPETVIPKVIRAALGQF